MIQSCGSLFWFSSQEVLRVTARQRDRLLYEGLHGQIPCDFVDCHRAYMNKTLSIIVPDHSWYFHFERKVVVSGQLKCQQKFAISCGDFLLLQKRKTVVGLHC